MKVSEEQLKEIISDLVKETLLREQVESLGNKVLELGENSTEDLANIISYVLGNNNFDSKQEKEVRYLLNKAIIHVVATVTERNSDRKRLGVTQPGKEWTTKV